MPRALTLAPKAQADLEAISDYAAAWDNPQAEEKLRARLAAALQDLLEAPCRWPVHEHPQVRERPVGEYRIMYEVVNDTGDTETAGDVKVLRVFHGRQDRGRV
jgi:plasmid stabilization system protein ParE